MSEGPTPPQAFQWPDHAVKSAFDRLRSLPDTFTLNTFVRFTGMTRASARVTLSRWQARGLVESAGPRSAIYFNRLRDLNGTRATAVAALGMRYPSATLCGASVLHAHGWTTQIPAELHVAVERRRSYAQITGVVLHPRPVKWFRAMHAAGALQNDRHAAKAPEHQLAPQTPQTPQAQAFAASSYGIRSLSPAWALADSYADESGRSWKPDEDDLDIPEEDEVAVVEACAAMGVDVREVLPGLVEFAPRQR